MASSYTNGMPNKLVFTLHGCGGYVTSGTNLPKLPNFPNTLYVQWQGGDSGCYDDQSRASPEYDVFDALLTEIENTFCIDKNRVFADGFSSGAWMAMMLGCQRANVVKAHGQGAGGLPISIRPAVDCKGPEPALFSHGTADDQNHIHGSHQDRDRLLKTNQCDSTTKPYGGFAQCVEYQNCLPGYPVVYCEYPGLGHSPGAIAGRIDFAVFQPVLSVAAQTLNSRSCATDPNPRLLAVITTLGRDDWRAGDAPLSLGPRRDVAVRFGGRLYHNKARCYRYHAKFIRGVRDEFFNETVFGRPLRWCEARAEAERGGARDEIRCRS